MTTNATLVTHDWPVEITRFNPDTGEEVLGKERVEPHSQVSVMICNDRAVTLRELPKDDPVLTV